MQAVILAGGLGTRLKPHTKYFNKHVIPVYDVPMLHFSLTVAHNSKCTDLIICLSGNQPDVIMNYITSNWSDKFASVSFIYDPETKGTGYSLQNASHLFSDNESILVVCGDNIFHPQFNVIKENTLTEPNSCHIFIAKTDSSYQRGSYVKMEFSENHIVKDVIRTDEPIYPEYLMAGIAIYGPGFKTIIKNIDISKTYDIFEITSFMCKNHKCSYSTIDTWWYDAGTHEGLFKATETYRNWKLNN